MLAVRRDPELFRAFLRVFNLLDRPEAVLARADLAAKVQTGWEERRSRAPRRPIGPSREELLDVLGSG
jgi:hypothetical protein